MLTLDEAPWMEYLEIDEETFERKLRDDTPQDIREKYEKHLAESKKQQNEMQPK